MDFIEDIIKIEIIADADKRLKSSSGTLRDA